MSDIRTERSISTGLPAAGRSLLADITASSVWSEATLQYFFGGSTTLGFDPEFRAPYDGTPTTRFDDGSSPDATFAFVTQMERGFRMIDSVIATDFTRVTTVATAQAQADIVLVSSNQMDDANLEGFCMFPGSATRAANDYWSIGAFNSTPGVISGAPELGGGEYLNWTLIHEVGHGLGLLHPFLNGTTLASVGAAMDNERYTVMSYTGATPSAQSYGHAVTMMALDIAALQQQYGAETYAAGTSYYTLLNPRAGALSLAQNDVQIGRAYYCIWDSGGIDTIDYGSAGNAVLINLNDATLDRSQVAADAAPAITALQYTNYYDTLSAALRTETINSNYHAGGFFSRVMTHSEAGYAGVAGGFSIANGALIENATGGGRDDMLIGNEQANRLTGNAGHDVMIGSRGNDTLDGGEGCDTAAFSGARADYDITTVRGVTTVVHARGSRADGTDVLTGIEHAQFSNELFSLFDPALAPFTEITSSAFRPFGANTLHENDDGSSSAVNITSIFEQGIHIGDQTFTSIYVNNNGNITFGGGLSTFTPREIGGGSGLDIIAPFWADVDTRDTVDSNGNPLENPGTVTWDFNAAHDSIVITWNDVGYYRTHWDRQNSFQLELIDRGCGNLEIVFRYDSVTWTTGDASGGTGGLGGTVARAGFSLGETYFELPASGAQGSILGLAGGEGNQGVAGVWQFLVADGQMQGVGDPTPENYTGTGNGDSYFGDAGNDTLSGLGGDDFLYGGNGNDRVDGGVGDDSLSGNAGADTVIGGTGNDTLRGDGGTDVMLGGAGNDIYFVDAAGDRIFETTTTATTVDAGGIDTVMSSVTLSLDAYAGVRFVERLTLTGAAALNGTGNALANTITGNAGNNVLYGGLGNDTINGGIGNDSMLGGAGNDTYYVNAAGDRVFETTTMATTINAGGIDTVISSVAFNLNAYAGVRFVERLTLTGTAAISGNGNALANTITGNAGSNVLNGGLGSDVLASGAGSDAIVFNTALGASNIDRITDFNVPSDTIRLENAVFTGLTAGALAASAFTANLTGTATDALDRIVYERDTGFLYFDVDGNGAGARVQFATVTANLALTQADFLIT